MNRRGTLGLAAGVLIAAVAITLRGRAELVAPNPGGETPSHAAAGMLAGNPSCSARGCHGRLEAVAGQRVQQNEYLSWTLHDKHGRAYEVLRSERAQRMARNLAAGNKYGAYVPAQEDARCLACHATPQLANAPKSTTRDERLADGVGCEACHGRGGTGDWLTAHYGSGWSKLLPPEKKAHGLNPLGDLDEQARTCAGCHVGAPPDPDQGIPARDLNHDLMAAGHPRLTFELGSYRVNMPPHWRADLQKKDKEHPEPGYEARVWSVGQVESARASLDLLAYRAERAESGLHPWPEFAEADCFACHADLRPKSRDWRAVGGASYFKGRKPGTVPYCEWYSAMLPALPVSADSERAYRELDKLMNRASPKPGEIASKARAGVVALEKLSGEIRRADYDRAAVGRLLDAVIKQTNPEEKLGWDRSTQAALAVAALRQAAADLGVQDVPPKLDLLYSQLAYPPGYESPRDFRRDASRFDQGLELLRPAKKP